MIVISNPVAIENEIKIIHSLFAEGLELLHIRKPHFSKTEMESFVSEIGLEFRNRLVLHQHHDLAEEFRINRFHFSENDRVKLFATTDRFQKPVGCISTSTHSIGDFNALDAVFDYAFLSPIFPSISKLNYLPETDAFEAIKKRTNFSTKLIALGGISSENIQQTLQNNFDDVALLGTIWNSKNPLENFKKCQQIVHSHSL